MRIGCDLDGVLADLHSAFARVALDLFPDLDPAAVGAADAGASPPDPDRAEPSESETAAPTADVPITRRQVSAVWSALAAVPNFWESLDEIESGGIARLAKVVEDRRWEVIFLTSRPDAPGRSVQRQSQRWLDRHGFPLPSVFVVHGSRGRIAEALALDVVVDDRPENCLDVVLESRAKAILIWRASTASVPASAKRLGIGVAPSVAACLDVLLEAERAAASPTDLIERLRRLLGLQTRPAGSGR